MKYRHYTGQEIVEKTREAIHLFLEKQVGPFLELLDEDFVWVGDYESLYMRGVSSFAESIREESREQPVELTDEEYALLAHERHLWVTYGRFTAIDPCTAEGLSSRIHFTLVWQQIGDSLRLIHANGCHAKPMPERQSKIFESAPPRQRHTESSDKERLVLRDLN